MTRLDRYILRQLLGPFLFFVLVFTGVIWLSQSLRVIDTVVNNGQSALVFLEFAALLLPTVMSVVLPVSAFAATLTALNRMVGDSELVVMQAAGMSGGAIMRPVALFSGLVMIALAANTVYAMPTAKRMLQERLTEVRGDLAAAFLREGAFMTPTPGITVYLREMGRPGEMLGVFVHDERDPEQVVTYAAKRALLIQEADPPVLVMFDGVAQSASASDWDTVSTLRFDQLSYDLAALAGDAPAERTLKPSEMYLPRLLTMGEAETGNRPLGEYRAEGHEAIAGPLYAMVLPLLGAGFVIGAGFRRRGIAGRIALAVVAGLALRLLGLAAKSAVSGAAGLWPLFYLPPLLGLALAWWLLSDRVVALSRRTRQQGT